MELIFWVGIVVGSVIGSIIGVIDNLKNQSKELSYGRNKHRDSKNLFSAIGGLFIGSVCGFILSLVTWIIIGSEVGQVEPNEMVSYKLDERGLVAIADAQSTEVNGVFFLGVGSISGGGTAYWAYEELESNKYKQITFDPSETIIIEDIDSLSSPYFIEVREKIDSVVFNDKMKYDGWMLGPKQIDKHIGWEVHIPKGSIVHDFNLDLK